jgi:fido (protein-threonine AMPylation protein)
VLDANKLGNRRGRPSRLDVYRRLDTQIGELRERLGGLPAPAEASRIWKGIWLEEAHHSTAIEGNTLAQRQVEQLLADGLAVGNKELREYMEVRGYATAAEWVYGQAIEPGDWASGELITLSELRHVHRLALQPVWDVAPHGDAGDAERPGNWRQHDIEPFPGGMQPPDFTDVPRLVTDWVAQVSAIGESADAPFPEVLARVHAGFEQIHPFLDGNGRAGRLALNLILIRSGYPPAIIYKRDRDNYLRALRRSDRGDQGPLGELLARAVLDNLYRFIVPAVAGPARLVPLPALAREGFTPDALRVAASRGRLEAVKAADGTWRSSRNWVDEYVASKYRRG